jgi:hypothetical protein
MIDSGRLLWEKFHIMSVVLRVQMSVIKTQTTSLRRWALVWGSG